MNKAIAEGKRFHEPSFYGALTKEELGHIFRSETATQIPLLDDRVAVLKQVILYQILLLDDRVAVLKQVRSYNNFF